jgi:hypothetical protein
MTSTSLVSAPPSRRLRAAAPRVHGGASSLLRLGRSGETRLPSGAALSGWAERAGAMLDLTPMMVGPHTQALRAAQPVHDLPVPASVRGAQA